MSEEGLRTGYEIAVIIEPRAPSAWTGLSEAWRSRSLAAFLVWRDLKVRYKQTAVGAGWALVQPVAMTIVFAIVLGRLAKVPSDGRPYWLMVMSGIVAFSYFSQAMSAAANSLVENTALVSKVYFPRLLLPAAAAGSALLDAMLSTLAVVVAAALAGEAVWHAPLTLLVPAAVWVASLSIGIWLAALNVRYRDVRAVLPLMIQVWMFATPVVYPVSLIPDRWQLVYSLNPMVGLVELQRFLLFGEGSIGLLIPGLAVMLLGITLATRSFLRATVWFADLI